MSDRQSVIEGFKARSSLQKSEVRFTHEKETFVYHQGKLIEYERLVPVVEEPSQNRYTKEFVSP